MNRPSAQPLLPGMVLKDYVNTATDTPSAVSWSAVAAGAIGAAALSLILLMLGTGFGLSALTPWARESVSTSTLNFSTILWISITQLLASGLGGYLAGRLRTRWADLHGDEVYFRDTVHGFLAWAVATLATAALLVPAITYLVNGGVPGAAGNAAREMSEQARHAAAYASLWLFISLLIGAFASSYFATFGGRRRDA